MLLTGNVRNDNHPGPEGIFKIKNYDTYRGFGGGGVINCLACATRNCMQLLGSKDNFPALKFRSLCLYAVLTSVLPSFGAGRVQ